MKKKRGKILRGFREKFFNISGTKKNLIKNIFIFQEEILKIFAIKFEMSLNFKSQRN